MKYLLLIAVVCSAFLAGCCGKKARASVGLQTSRSVPVVTQTRFVAPPPPPVYYPQTEK